MGEKSKKVPLALGENKKRLSFNQNDNLLINKG
jgi:hypothetical protein